ncbi:MAG: apolipoprotein N-acyltransferase [Candidatus Omnitrophica bacterium]|nr:apolipoprotein N-acyltransferase [Candidatus Omnitrophota bacterium]MCM8777725.1 apolipoprotein N-acyltransferase [Candidatus Omnitrophota bacterium]
MKNKRSGLSFRFFLSIMSGILFVFAFPPFDIWQLAFLSLVPLLMAAKEDDGKNFFLGVISGFLFYSISFSWLYRLAGPIYFLIALYLSIYWGIFLYLIFGLPERGRIFTAGAVWFLLEIIVSYLLTGFPWLLLGLSQWKNPYLIKMAGMTGIYGLSFLVILGNFTILYSFRKRYLLSWIISLAVFAAVIFFPLSSFSSLHYGENLKIMVVQPNIDTLNRSSVKDIEKIKAITLEYIRKEKVDIIIWPEGIYPDIITSDIIDDLKKFTLQLNTGLILGTFTEQDGKMYNSAILIEGEDIQIYNKTHLVPYGEFIPGGRMKAINRIFERMAGYIPHLKRGSELTPFSFRDKKIGVLVCFENIFPEITATLTEEDAGVFIVITNDGWFGNSSGPYQHFAHNSIRAVETGRYFVQSSLTGISGVVSPDGTVEDIVNSDGNFLFVDGVSVCNIPMIKGKTFYSSFGDIPLFILSVLITGVAICKKTWKN